ncbi:hypothetical protein [Neotabrizicola sp. sgz301269]|uniref:hypothetical protein n=1 Tax=Neotabrizicola sp. sgz301269 TaxID=3276282 RepID=UPI00376FAE3A
MTERSPFRCFKTSPSIVHFALMLTIRFPLSGLARVWWRALAQFPALSLEVDGALEAE